MRNKSSKKHGVNSLLNKSQSAMEYLMTYGWAILIIAIVLVALFSLGIFNSANFAPRAQPGSCEVLRNSVQTSLVGQCNGMLPEYVASITGGYMKMYSSPTAFLPNYTVNLWINFLGASGEILDSYMSIPGDAPACSYYVISVNPLDVGSWNAYETNNWITSYSNITVPKNTWSMITMALSKGGTGTGTLTFYINGGSPDNTSSQEVNPGTSSLTSQSGSIMNVGGSGCPGNVIAGTLQADLANMQIYNTSLSQSEIQALYKEGIGGAPINVNNLVGWWPFNGNANDYSGNDNNGVPINVTYTSAWTSSYSTP